MTQSQLPPFGEFKKLVQADRKGKAPFELFETFLSRVMRHLGFKKATRVQRDIARYLQFGPQKIIIQAFRGVGKSFVTAAFVIWTLLNNPQWKIMVVSASKERSDSFSQFVKKLIMELPECAHLKPQPGQRFSNVSFDVGPAITDQSPSVKSVGITGQITGSRADIIIADDIEIPKNSWTAVMRERTAQLVTEFDNVIKPLDHTRIIYLGTPQTEQSLYNLLRDERQYLTRIWPSNVPKDHNVYRGNLAPIILEMIERGIKPGVATDHERFDTAYLKAKELTLGRSNFALQFMLDTSLADGDAYPLKLEDLMVLSTDTERGPVSLAYGKDPRNLIDDLQPVGFNSDFYYRPMFVDKEFAPWQGSVMSIDPSGRGKDETAYCVLRSLHGRLYLVASGGLHGGSTPENLQELADIAKKHRVNSVVLEVNFGDGMFGQLLKPVLTATYPVTIEEYRATGQKEKRIINTLEPVMQQHRLVIDRSVVEADLEAEPCYSLFYQMTRLSAVPKCLQHDDRLDCLAQAVDYFRLQMETDTQKAAKDHVQELLDAELEAFISGDSIFTDTQPLWGNASKANWLGQETRH